MNDILTIAKNCRHYAMCKIDFLGNGVCPSGLEKHYVSFYPQGRMDLYAALAENKIPVTEKCVEIADSCDLCGKCDPQCYFVTEMRPTAVMKGLKAIIADHLRSGGKIIPAEDEPVIAGLKKIVGDDWATGDRGIALTYAHDPGPLTAAKMPAYVIMPQTKEEIAAVVKWLNQHGIQYAIRGNGSSVMGFVMSSGAVIDLGRMKTMEFDEKNWLVRTGPGVSAFELQQEAVKRGYRVNVAEPSALVLANIMCSGIFSCFSAAYGTAAENVVDAEFVAADGSFFSLNQKSAPNVFAFAKNGAPIPGICTSASVKLHAVMPDEKAVLVPFQALAEAIAFAKECAVRRIGIAIGVLGSEYISTFLSPTKKLAREIKDVFSQTLGIEFLVLVIGDPVAIRSLGEMGHGAIGKDLFKTISLALPALKSAPWLELLHELADEKPFSYLGLEKFNDLAEAALSPSPELLTRDVDPELKPFFAGLYARPEMTDLVWLNMFRIVSSRMGREKHALPLIIYLPMEGGLLSEINLGFRRIADKYQLKNDFGFVTPLDGGKRCVFEYDFYLDHTSEAERARTRQAASEAAAMIEEFAVRTGTVRWIGHVFGQGFSRMENLLYG
ncbi:MAG TPA: FAD-binding protein [Candidatus Binatia bacterium]|nr:FAD-binding protein [Candidatus Binatia bacterium]